MLQAIHNITVSLNELSFDVLMYGGQVGFLILTLVLVCGFILLSILRGKRLRYAFLISHTILVCAVGLFVKASGGDAMSGLVWLILLIFDFSVWPLKVVFGSFSSWDFSLMFLCLIVVGGAQWYFTGQLIDYLWPKLIAKFKRPQASEKSSN